MATIDIFNLSPRDFNLQMQEEAMYRTPAELDELRREYRNRNSMAGKLMGLLAPEEGKRRSTFLPVDAPQGMSIFDALRSGQATPAVPQGLVDLITGGTRGVESAREYAQGVPPRADALNDALTMAGLAMTGGGAVAKPKGSLGAFFAREDGTLEDALKLAKSGRGIFHSSQADQFDEINKYGVEPQYGPWTREIAEGATEDPRFLDEMPMAAWWSEQPDWVKMKTARAAGKSVNDVTVDDIRKYGHLSIADADEYADTVYRIPEEGIDYEGSQVSDLTGEKMPLYATDLYEFGDDNVGRYPFGIERNELVTRETIDPKYSLTGQDLIDFMRDYDTTAANASKSAGLLTTAASEAQDMAKRILELRAEGRASEVTDEMMAQADPQYMFANTPLPMDEASRIARAEAAGFEGQTYYHGAKDTPELPYFDRIDEYNTEGHAGTIYGTSSPAVANTYVRRSNIGIDEGAIYPLLARRDPNDPTINVGGVYSRIPMSIRDEKGQRLIDVLPEAAEMDHLNAERVTSTDAIASAMRDADFSMLRMENVVDRGPYYPDATPLGFEVRSYKDIERQNEFNKWNRETLAEANEPATNIMVQDPTKLRSRFARFDPEFSHLSNLSAANVSPLGGLLAQSGVSDKQAERIEEYLRRRGLLD